MKARWNRSILRPKEKRFEPTGLGWRRLRSRRTRTPTADINPKEEQGMADGLLTGDAALVTGAASGIGRGIAHALAREGARVVLADVDADRGESAAAALRDEGREASFIACDLARRRGPGPGAAATALDGRSSCTARARGASSPTPSSGSATRRGTGWST
jgi:hypothetical protein